MLKIINIRVGLFLFAVMVFNITSAQQQFHKDLFDAYNEFKETSIEKRRFTHSQLQPLIKKFSKKEGFTVKKVGESIEGRSLNLISLGTGDTNVFLWSQMHGDESTATMAIFDLLNFFDAEAFSEEKQEILSEVTLHFLPMLNPDGAQRFKRRNALGIDINRDALRLQSPAGKTLKGVRDSLDADFGFNLHDQSTYYNAERTLKPASVSFLAPAYNYEKSINEVRGNAMKIIVAMNRVLQQYAPGQVARYNDDFEPRAFGDNIQKWGTSTILIESGGYPNDPEKQEIRKLNFVSILSAIAPIANKSYEDIALEKYEEIPHNDRKLFDLKLTGLTYELKGEDYILDLGLNRREVQLDSLHYYERGYIADRGDLSTNYAYKALDAKGYKLVKGKVYTESFQDIAELEEQDIKELLINGFAYVRLKELPVQNFSDLPINIVAEDFEVSEALDANFFLQKEGKLKYAVINGNLIDLFGTDFEINNALILR